MAFNADEYIAVIVEQIANNFTDLEYVIKNSPDLTKAIENYRTLQNKGQADFFALREASVKVEIYQKSIASLVGADYRTVEPLSVGLFGEWGSGKTHLLKLIESRINQLQTNPLNHEKDSFPYTTIPIFFNAWRFEKEEHLIIPLFQSMLAQLEAYEHFTFKDKTKKFSKSTWQKFKVLSASLLKGLQMPQYLAGSVEKLANGDITAIADMVDKEKVSENYEKGKVWKKSIKSVCLEISD